MRKFILPVFFMAISVLVFGQDKVINDANAVVRNVAHFTSIKVNNGIELMLKQGSVEAVAVSAANVQDRDRIITEVKNGELNISIDNSKPWKFDRQSNRKLKAYVSVQNLDKLQSASGAKIFVDGELHFDDISIDISSGGTLLANLKGASVKITQSSGGTAKLSGAIQNIDIDVSSGAKCNGYDLVVNSCDAEASSGAKIEITIQRELSANVSSGGALQFKGDGVMKNISSSSGGKVSRSM